MSTTVSNQFSPDFAVAPGETLSELLDDNGMSQAELARRTGLSAKHINQIVSGDASITAETAIRLERVTKVPSRFWLNLEAQYQDLVTRQREACRSENCSSAATSREATSLWTRFGKCLHSLVS